MVALAAIQCMFVLPSNAANLSEQSSFEYVLKQADDGAPGNIVAQLYVETYPRALITTAGATLVINTAYVDVVDKAGNAITDNYKADVKVFGKEFAVSATKIGSSNQSFSSIKGLSLASYNAKTKNMYIFICGMSLSGVQIQQKSQIASFYLNAKQAKLPAGAIRLAKQSEIGKECPSQAVYVNEISSKEEVPKEPCPIQLRVDESFMETETEPASEAATTQNTPASEKATQQDSKHSDKKGEQVPSSTTPQPVTKAVADMSETEIKTEIQQKATQSKSLKLTDAQKASDAYKAYQKAVEEAEKVAKDDTASVEQKREALQKVRDAQKALEKQFPALAEQLQTNSAADQSKAGGVWLYIGIGAAVVALAVIIVLIIKNKKKKVISNP